ncbi:Phosphoglycolate phosphatase, HAD superfamily [Chitinophaga sp. YR627]|uniref:HAD family hydrolase n=1 Tax=Chitinophaga sp. YR627 TaxID=1881041 RepID=UPI0008E5F5CB|nr:HAD hydrolase-like protein [Chitinophaga sp. YR627]SFN31544.1 Phosphoglycolate phosphatase, HAD superfamily [Chitinophaga sp. YR627]
MKYIIFDIDGTLTNTTEIDDLCYTQAIAETFGFSNFNTNYGHYENTTDSGILNQLSLERRNRPCTVTELENFIDCFCNLLERAHEKQPHYFQEIPKAGSIINSLVRNEDLRIGLATGGWKQSALFKLQCAGIDIEGCSAASFAQDAFARRDIIGHTISKMNKRHNTTPDLSDIIYVGDGNWDYQATLQLGIKFIGIDNKKLAHLQDIIKISDYDELEQHIGLLTLTS